MPINVIPILVYCVLLNSILMNCAPKLGSFLFEPLLYEANLTNNDTTYQYEEPRIQNNSKSEINQQFNVSKKSSTNKFSYLRNKASEQKTNLRLSNNSRKLSNNEVENVKKPCLGYDFDETLCKTVGDRVICGYNKNIGNITNKINDFGNGCRIRDDRLECGYWLGPFTNPRRPPARDDYSDEFYKHLNKIKRTYQFESTSTTTSESSANYTNTREYSSKMSTIKGTSMSSNIVKKPSFTSSFKSLLSNSILRDSSKIPSSLSPSVPSKLSILIATRTSTKQISKRHCVEKNDHIFCYTIKL